MSGKPRRVKEIEEEAILLKPCQKVGSIVREGDEWETWLCPLEDRSAILVQEYQSYAVGGRRKIYEIHLTEDEVAKLAKEFSELKR